MKDELFNKLVESVHEGGEILRKRVAETMTPETLRALSTAQPRPWWDVALHDKLEAAADAWEADILMLNTWLYENGELAKRLEAAERYKISPATTRPDCIDHAGRLTEFGKGYSRGYLDRTAEVHAALATNRAITCPECGMALVDGRCPAEVLKFHPHTTLAAKEETNG